MWAGPVAPPGAGRRREAGPGRRRQSSGCPAGGRGDGRRHEEAVQSDEAAGQPDRRQVRRGAGMPWAALPGRAGAPAGLGRRLRSPFPCDAAAGGRAEASAEPRGEGGRGTVGLPAPLPSGAFWGRKTSVSSGRNWRDGGGGGRGGGPKRGVGPSVAAASGASGLPGRARCPTRGASRTRPRLGLKVWGGRRQSSRGRGRRLGPPAICIVPFLSGSVGLSFPLSPR